MNPSNSGAFDVTKILVRQKNLAGSNACVVFVPSSILKGVLRFAAAIAFLCGFAFAARAGGVSKVAAGAQHSLYLKTDGTLWAMGLNNYGQLGDGTTANRNFPVKVANGVNAVAAGFLHSLYLKTDGTLWAMGNNGTGQLGDGTTTDRSTAVQVATGVSKVAAGTSHSLYLKTDGTLWAMGFNSAGQLGDGTIKAQPHPTPSRVASGVSAVAAGENHSLFVKTDETLWAMGLNSVGQLGDGTRTQRVTPVQVASGVTSVVTKRAFTLYLKTDGTLWAMGDNNSGQLGDGTTTNRISPVQIMTGVSAAAAGDFHSLFVTNDGVLWAMGWNGFGLLGDGTTTNRVTPVQVAAGVSAVAAGGGHSLFVKTDGALWTMGDNGYGQLGDGTTLRQASPVEADGAPVIVKQPSALAIVAGGTASFTVIASGPAPFTYQWRKEGVNLSSFLNPTATAATFSLLSASLSDAGSYTVAVSNAAGSVTSNAALLIVTSTSTPPVIVAQPSSFAALVGGRASLTVVASGTAPLTYQWRKDGAAISGATSATFGLVSAASSDAGSYTVVVTNPAGSANSAAAILSVYVAPTITTQPISQTVNAGGSASFTVIVGGTAPLSFQWKKDGATINGATSGTCMLSSVTSADAGSYTVVVTNPGSSITSNAAVLTVPTIPTITIQPQTQIVQQGTIATLTVAASGVPAPTYQWSKDGIALGGATNSTFVISSVQPFSAGNYAVVVRNSVGSVNSAAATLLVSTGLTSRLSNLSVRTTLAANQTLTVGFTIQGGAKNLLVRAAGPSLGALGVSGTMPDPKLALFNGVTLIATNDNWSGDGTVAAAIAAVGAFPFISTTSLDAALVRSVDGGRTVQVSGSAAGNVIVELYDTGTGLSPRLTNLSALNFVGTGSDQLIAGFTVSGTGTKNVLIRAAGPSLAPFGVPGALVDPKLELYNSSQTKIAENDTYSANLPGVFTSVGAFAFVTGAKDAALMLSLPSGGYTVVVSGADGGIGNAIVEVYELP